MRLSREEDILKHAHDVTLANGAKHRCFDVTLLSELPEIDAIPIQYILTTIRQWNRDGYAESAEALEILVMNWEKEKGEI